ncbi:MAG: glycosyltransferase [Labilithrix sp.]|nr:glycosyltransferase [Labilithrix sp.]MCW5815327.1 glycosyltransferase [Labilithrix sp.]
MRVVHLTTEFPWPATSGGPVRTLSQLRIIASLPEVTSITLLSVRETDVPSVHVDALAHAFDADGSAGKLLVEPPVFHPIHLFDFKQYVPRVIALRLLGTPYLAGKWDSKHLRPRLRAALTRDRPDVVYIDHLGMAEYLPDVKAVCPRARVVLDQHNVESDFFKQFAGEKTGPKKLVARAEHRAAAAFEKHVLRTVDAVVAISNEDAKVFADFVPSVRAHVVPVVMTFDEKQRPHPGRPHFCYVGSLRWKPNVLGLDWFCQKVWPLVRARVPNATFEIAGVGLKPDDNGKLPIPETWRAPGIETVGFLEDLEPLYARSLGMIAPITGGSGVRMKLLEGFRAGLSVVTTPDGAFGLPLTDGKEALITQDPAAFAERVARIVDDGDLRARLVQAGYDFLETHHSLRVAQDVMRDALGAPIPK